MKAVVFHGIGDIRLETVRDPKLKEPTDALIRITASAICGTDLHFVRGTMTGPEPGTVLGHEAVGSKALGATKVDLFTAALEAWLGSIAEVVKA